MDVLLQRQGLKGHNFTRLFQPPLLYAEIFFRRTQRRAWTLCVAVAAPGSSMDGLLGYLIGPEFPLWLGTWSQLYSVIQS
jgi:hypothetical protein